MKKRILSLLLAAALCLGMTPLSVAAEQVPDLAVWDGGFLVKYGHILVGYEGEGGRVVIPDGITELESTVFQRTYEITEVVIPYGVTSIPDQAFYRCYDLAAVMIPDSVTYIGHRAFSYTDLTSVVLPDSVEAIPEAFRECGSLETVSLGRGLTAIPANAFTGSGLTEVVIPDTVTAIGTMAFGLCDHLVSVAIPPEVKAIDETAFAQRVGTNVWSNWNRGLSVSCEADSTAAVYAEKYAADVVLGTFDADGTFVPDPEPTPLPSPEPTPSPSPKPSQTPEPSPSPLASPKPSSSVAPSTRPSPSAPPSATAEPAPSVTPSQRPSASPAPTPSAKPSQGTSSGGGSIGGGGGGGGGGGSSISQPTAAPTQTPAPITTPTPQSDFIIDDNGVLTRYQGTATDVVIPDGVTGIAAATFQGSSVMSVTMPNSVTSIGDNAFRYCFHLHAITLSKNLNKVGNNIFYDCDELKDVINAGALGDKKDILLATRCDIIDGTLYHCDSGKNGTLVVPNGVTRIARAEGSSHFYTGNGFSRVVFPDTLKVIEGNPFERCYELTEIEFGKGITTIGANAFSNCNKLRSLDIPDNIESIGSMAFGYCDSLSEVSIANPDIKIADDAFDGCYDLKYYDLAGQKVKVYIRAKAQAAEAKKYWEQEIRYRRDSDTYRAELKTNREFLEQYISDRDYIYTTVTNDVQKVADEVCREWNTDLEKVFAIHEWITENIYYDHACLHDGTLHFWTAQEAVQTKKAVCNGYAVLFQAMCWAEGIPCVYVTGDTTAGYHAWNAVKVDSEWKWVDCTWDTYNSYSGNDFWNKGATRMYYFLCPSEFITTDHVVRESYDFLTGETHPQAFVVDGINATLPEQPWEEKEAIIKEEQELQEESLKKQQEAEILKKDDSLSDWALSELQSAIRTELVPERLKGLYRGQITREEFCVLMVHLLTRHSGKDIDAMLTERTLSRIDPFVDTDNTDVLAAYALGIVKGTSATTFAPDGKITRQEAATMLARTGQVLLVKSGQSESFADVDTFADWAAEGIAFVSGVTDPYNGKKVMEGTGGGQFSPTATYSREQAIITALRLFSAAGNQTIRKGPSGE